MGRLRVIAAAAVLFLGLSSCTSGGKAKNSSCMVGFYNVENLFDTQDDPGKDDSQFLPEGPYGWNDRKYQVKVGNIAHVIFEMGKENGQFLSVIGLAEVENDRVLKDLVSQDEIAGAKYSYIHFESPDERGVDVALLYRQSRFKPRESKAIPYDFNSRNITFSMSKAEKDEFATRDILMVRGELDGEMFAFFVAHLPSRRGERSDDTRWRGAEIIYDHAMALEKQYPGIKIVVMGDMNDNPEDESMTKWLHGKETIAEVSDGDFFSPFLKMHKDGAGSEEYHGDWNIFDIIMVNKALAGSSKGYRIQKSDDTHYGYIFNAPFLVQQQGRYKGTPYRTFSGGKFIKGYSDHYPTFIKLGR